MTVAVLILVLALLWIAVSGTLSILTVGAGLLIAVLTLLMLRNRVSVVPWLGRFWQGIGLAGFFLKELTISAVQVGAMTLMPGVRTRLRPGIVAVPLTIRGDMQITLLASMVTLTPGTLSVDVSDDNAVLFVHALTLRTPEQVIADIHNGFEARIRKVFG